jgi:hypothetical protein
MRRLVLSILLACSSKPSGTISLVTGAETDVFSRAPAPTKLVVDALAPDGTTKTITSVALPTTGVDLGDRTQTDVVSLRVSGVDDGGKRLVFGSSLFLAYGSLQDANFPVFVQRTGEWARMPGTIDARESPVVAVLNRRSVLIAGGDASVGKNVTGYDLATLARLTNTAVLPSAPRSMIVENNAIITVTDDGASSFSLSDARVNPVNPPTGMTFAEVAGGDVLLSDDGTAYLVGATRSTQPPTSAVLVVTTAGVVSAARLLSPRLGAAATFVVGKGVVVVGGSATGAGVELLAPNATSATALPFPPDATTGAGASLLSGSLVLVAGKDARTVDLACSTGCGFVAWKAGGGPDLVTSHVYGLDQASAILVGDDGTGATRSFALSPTDSKELAFKVPRHHARSLVAPTGAVLVVGGGSAVVESFFP